MFLSPFHLSMIIYDFPLDLSLLFEAYSVGIVDFKNIYLPSISWLLLVGVPDKQTENSRKENIHS